MRRAIFLHQRIGQQIHGEVLPLMVPERAEQRFQYLHIKALAQIKLRDRRNKLIGRNDVITAAHTAKNFVVSLSCGIADGLGIQYQTALVKRLLNLRQQPDLFACLIGNLFLSGVKR